MSHAIALHALHTLRNALHDLQQQRTTTADFCKLWRAQSDLMAALPPRYALVSEDLLGRMEASSLFVEESCSFSHDDLHGGLAVWLDKAGALLDGVRNANA